MSRSSGILLHPTKLPSPFGIGDLGPEAYKFVDTTGSEIHWDFIRCAWASVANTAIAPLQDVLGLGNEARMNLPNSNHGNWNWRYESDDLTSDIALRLKELTHLYGRAGSR